MSFRTYDAIRHGAIPVFIADYIWQVACLHHTTGSTIRLDWEVGLVGGRAGGSRLDWWVGSGA